MILYDPAQWAIQFAIQWEGSVVPKTMVVAAPAGLIAAAIALLLSYHDMPAAFTSARSDQLFASFTMVLGFLIVFRTRTAYSRFWEAASFLQMIRGGWFNVVSSCCAFCTTEAGRFSDVYEFQNTLVRLVSLLYASALHEVAVRKDNTLEVLDYENFDLEEFDYMQLNSKKTEILVQWVQKLIVENRRNGVLDVEAPILSRVFQELANGIIDLSNAKRICRYPFPFPYAQIEALLLMFHWGFTVWISGTTMGNPASAFTIAFIGTFCLWSMHYTSLEIEQPYGDDMNDLPLDTMQASLNDSLVNLLHPLTQTFIRLHVGEGGDIKCRKWRTDQDPNRRLKERKKRKGGSSGAREYKMVGKKKFFEKTFSGDNIRFSLSSNGGSALEDPVERSATTRRLSIPPRRTRVNSTEFPTRRSAVDGLGDPAIKTQELSIPHHHSLLDSTESPSYQNTSQGLLKYQAQMDQSKASILNDAEIVGHAPQVTPHPEGSPSPPCLQPSATSDHNLERKSKAHKTGLQSVEVVSARLERFPSRSDIYQNGKDY